MPERFLHLSRPLLAVASGLGANAAAAVASSESGDLSVSAVVGAITLAILAICGMIVAVAPVVANAIIKLAQTIGPALAELKKQREEISKGSYTGQIEELKDLLADLKEDNARVKADLEEATTRAAERDNRFAEREKSALEREQRLEENLEKARTSLHEIRNKLGTDIQARDVKIMELEEVINNLRLEIARLTRIVEERADSQDKRIQDNSDDIQRIIKESA